MRDALQFRCRDFLDAPVYARRGNAARRLDQRSIQVNVVTRSAD